MSFCAKFLTAVLSLWLCGTLTAAEFVKNGSFETGSFAPWRPATTGDALEWSIIADHAAPDGGSHALKLVSSQPLKTGFFQTLDVGPGIYRLSFQVNASGCTSPRGYVQAYLSGTVDGKWHNFGGVSLPVIQARNGWTPCESDIITVPAGGKIKTLHVKVIQVVGTVMMDGFSLENERTEPHLELTSRKHRNLFRFEETPELGMVLINPLKQPAAMRVRFRTTDYFGRPVLHTEKEFAVPARGRRREVLRYPELTLPGFYCTTVEWSAGPGKGKTQSSFVKVGPIPEKKDPLFGISFFADNDDAERWAMMGVGSKGVSFPWTTVVNARPEVWERYLRQIKALKEHGIEPVGGFSMHYGKFERDYWKRWMPKGKVPDGQPEPTMRELQEVLAPVITKIVTSYKPYIRTWFLGGEIEGGFQRFENAVNVHIGMIRFTSAAIRNADPDAVIGGTGCGGGRVYPRFPWVKKLLPVVKDCLDGLALDTYTSGQLYGKGYVTLNSEAAELRPMMLEALELAKATRQQFVAIAEKGPFIVRDTPLDSAFGVSMANIAARDYILLKTLPKVRTWLYFRPDNWNSKSVRDWGMWEKEDPRQVVSAYAATARIMGFAEFVRELPVHQDLPCWIFRKDSKPFAALWYNGREPLKVDLPPDIAYEVRDVQGNPVTVADHAVWVGEAPVYLHAHDLQDLEQLLKNAGANTVELQFCVEQMLAGKVYLSVRNLSGHPVELKVRSMEVSGPGQIGRKTVPCQDRLTLAGGETRTLSKTTDAETVTFHMVTGNGREYTASAELKAVKVPKVGSFEELEKKAVPQRLDDPVRQILGHEDLVVHGNYTGLADLSGEFRLGYDEKYLYLEVRVKDDIHRNDNTSQRLFAGDCIQFAIDARRDARLKRMRGITGYSDDDFNAVAALASGKPATQFYAASRETRARLLKDNYPLKPEITRDEAAKTTLYRVKLAFADLAPLKPEKGRNFGFSLLIFDRDTPTSFYSMAFSPGVSQPFDPAQYPAFQFE